MLFRTLSRPEIMGGCCTCQSPHLPIQEHLVSKPLRTPDPRNAESLQARFLAAPGGEQDTRMISTATRLLKTVSALRSRVDVGTLGSTAG